MRRRTAVALAKFLPSRPGSSVRGRACLCLTMKFLTWDKWFQLVSYIKRCEVHLLFQTLWIIPVHLSLVKLFQDTWFFKVRFAPVVSGSMWHQGFQGIDCSMNQHVILRLFGKLVGCLLRHPSLCLHCFLRFFMFSDLYHLHLHIPHSRESIPHNPGLEEFQRNEHCVITVIV